MNEITENQKYNNLVKTARQLFMKFGIRKVTVEEICAEAGISKMTYYKHFKNKIELAGHILTTIYNEEMAKYNQTMNENIPFPEKVKKLVILKQKSTGAISNELMKDIWKKPIPEINKHFEELRQDSMSKVLKDLKKAQRRGDVRKGINVKFILYILNHLADIAKDPGLEQYYKSPNALIMEITNFFFYGIMGENIGKNEK